MNANLRPWPWPPQPELDSVLALIDGKWIQVDQRREEIYEEATDFAGRAPEPWERFEPVWLDSHGCGCCAKKDPTPTGWILLPSTEPRNG